MYVYVVITRRNTITAARLLFLRVPCLNVTFILDASYMLCIYRSVYKCKLTMLIYKVNQVLNIMQYCIGVE